MDEIIQDYPSTNQLVWKPHEGPQYEFLEAVASGEFYEVCYGGARGGGKTDAGIMSLLYDKEHPRYRALVIRKNAEDLTDWSDRAERWYKTQGAEKTGKPPEFAFPSGGKIRSGHFKDSNAYTKYQGHEYHKILVEELTQIPTEENYLKLASSCRSTIPSLRPCIISTCNPDGAGFTWVRKRFRIEGIPSKSIITVDPVTKLKRIFIPAKLSDNPTLSKDPSYRAFLDGLPDGLREAWRDGSWSDPMIAGAYYTKEIAQARAEGRIKLIPYDPKLPVHTVWDLGYDDSTTILFVQKTSDQVRLIDCYSNNNYGLDHYNGVLQERALKNKYVYGTHFAPHDSKKTEFGSGLTIIEQAEKMGIKFEVVKRIGIADGILTTRLMWPRLYINETVCEQALVAFMNYQKKWNEKLLKYDDEPLHDWSSHYADALRYLSIIENSIVNSKDEERSKLFKNPMGDGPYKP